MSNSDIGGPKRRASPVPPAECGLVHAATLIGDRASLLILREVFYGVGRFDDIQADLAMPRQALADRLRRLVDAGLLERRPYRAPGQRNRDAYHPTATAAELTAALLALTAWGERHAGLQPALVMTRADTGAPVRPALIDDRGHEVAPDGVAITVRRTGERV